ncbi:MAG: hypothetical protein RL215_2132 [Planctomycetota bacterium]
MDFGVPVMEDFADAACVIAVVFEPEWQSLDVGIEFTEVDAVVPDTERVRTFTGEE